jgi:hypothetical protein
LDTTNRASTPADTADYVAISPGVER